MAVDGGRSRQLWEGAQVFEIGVAVLGQSLSYFVMLIHSNSKY